MRHLQPGDPVILRLTVTKADYGMCEVAFLLFADTHVLEDRTVIHHKHRHSHVYYHEQIDRSAWEKRSRVDPEGWQISPPIPPNLSVLRLFK